MKVGFGKLLSILILVIFLIPFFIQKANAASLVSVSDTLTTSRPSAAAPLSAPIAAGAGQAQIFDNGSLFLASDSAIIYRDAANESTDVGLNIASVSAAGVPSATNKIVYFTNSTSYAHHQGVALISNITATHQIKFTTVSSIPASGTITITFPGSGSNSASPSATGFSLNGESATPTETTCYIEGVGNCGGSVSSNQSNAYTFTVGSLISGGSVIHINLGCTATSTGPCTAFKSRIINPTKTNQTAGQADTWKISIQTADNGGVFLDSGSLRAATVESVEVSGTVEPTITFTIAGVANGGTTSFSSLGTTGCGAEFSNTGIDSTATSVNLGLINNSSISKVAQTLTVSTNAATGYVITATSSGRFKNPSSGVYFIDNMGNNGLTANDTPGPQYFFGASTPQTVATGSASQAYFGISPCGARVPSNIWGLAGTIAYNSLFANPWNTGTNGYYSTIASWNGGPISSDVTVVRYSAGISGNTPAGVYLTNLSYIATAIF